MSAILSPCFYTCDPLTWGTDRLDVSAAGDLGELSQDLVGIRIDWEDVNQSVQAVFRQLAEAVQRRGPQVRFRPGRTITHLLLFSYCAFEDPSAPEVDPVVAGVDFSESESGKGIVVRADLSREETGVVLLTLAPRELVAEQEVVRVTGETLARQLVTHADRIVEALKQPNSGTSH